MYGAQTALTALTALLVAPAPAGAQGLPEPAPGYALRDAGGLTIEHAPDAEGNARRLGLLFERARAQVEETLGLPLPARPHAVLAATDPEFARRYAERAGRPPDGPHVLAVAFRGRPLVIVRERGLDEGGSGGLLPTLAHELAHLALFPLEERRGARLPLWLHEGLAEVAAGRRPTYEEQAAFEGWARFGTMPRLATLAERFPAHGTGSARGYTVAMGFVSWLAERRPLPELVAALGRQADVDAAFREVYGQDVADLELEWLVELSERHGWLRGLLLSFEPWAVIGALALLAAIRHWIRRRQLMRELEEQDAREEAEEAAREEEDGLPPVERGEDREYQRGTGN